MAIHQIRCQAVLGTEAHVGSGRLLDNRPKNVFGFRLSASNNRNITETETENFPVGYSVGYFTLQGLLRHVRTPMGKKNVFFECASAGTSAHYHTTVIHALQGAQHTPRVKTVYAVVPFGVSHWRTEQAGINSQHASRRSINHKKTHVAGRRAEPASCSQ